MGRTFAFVDESGNHDLDTAKLGSSSYFVVCSVIVMEKNLQQAAELAESLRVRNFQTGEIKSSNLKPKDSERRKRILHELMELPVKLFFTVVDKSRVHRDGGLKFKQPFIKYVNGLLYQRLFNHCENLHMTVDEHGGPEFQAGLRAYVEARYVDDLFREEAFQTKSSKDEVLIQVADFFAGSIAQVYEGKAPDNVVGRTRPSYEKSHWAFSSGPQNINRLCRQWMRQHTQIIGCIRRRSNKPIDSRIKWALIPTRISDYSSASWTTCVFEASLAVRGCNLLC